MALMVTSKIELPEKKNKDKEKINLLTTAINDAKYILRQYGKTLPEEAHETLLKILNDPRLKARGGAH